MKKSAKYFWVSRCGIFLFVIIAIIFYCYQLVPFKILNQKATGLPYKAFRFQNETLVYLPYQITIANNRLVLLNFERIDDQAVSEENPMDRNLVFTASGIKIDDVLEDTKYSRTIIPFMGKTYYYFKRHIITNNNATNKIDYVSAKALLNVLKSEVNIKLPQKVIDSLYQSDNGKRFNVYLGDRGISSTKYAKAKINSERQLQVILADSIKGMSKENAQNYLLKYAKKDIRTDLKDF